MEKINEKDSVALLRECYSFLNEVPKRGLNSRYFKNSYELAGVVGNYLKQIEKHDTGNSKDRETI